MAVSMTSSNIVFGTSNINFLKYKIRVSQIDAYIKERHTLANGFIKAKALEFPTTTLCMAPGQKTSIGWKYGLNYYDEIYMKDFLNSTQQ